MINEKYLDCFNCICLDCYEEFKTDTSRCKYSDCKWCKNEKGNYTERCRKYIEKGGNYDKEITIKKIIELNDKVNRKIIERAQFTGEDAGRAFNKVLSKVGGDDKEINDYKMKVLKDIMGDKNVL